MVTQMAGYESETSTAEDSAETAARDSRPMDDEEFQSVVQAAIADAIDFVDTEISPQRATATDYYHGKPFGNEEEGRSQIVLTRVRDAVVGMLPSLMRIFFGPERVVQYVPTSASKVDQSEQASDYAEYVFREDNAGFLQTYACLKDGLTRKTGIIKWWWDDSKTTTTHKLYGLTQEQVMLLGQEAGVAIHVVTPCDPTKYGAAPVPPAQPGTPLQAPPTLLDVEFTKSNSGRARVMTVPPEEFIFSRTARTIEDALFVGHRMEKSRSELLALGVPEKMIDEHGALDMTLKDNIEEITRRELLSNGQQMDPETGESNDKYLYVEGYMLVDKNGDGESELTRVCTLGPSYFPVDTELADERPFALFSPDPEPHTLVGDSIADRTMDIQKIGSAVLRAIMDSAASSIFPRTAYVEGQVNVSDILNTEIGAGIRMKAPGMVTPFAHPFLGKEMFSILEYLDDMEERRTGQNKGAMGLDADALQSTEKEAAHAAVTASQGQIEIIARVFAEQILKPLFKGLLRLLVTHQQESRMVRLRDKWVPIDPRLWDANMDVVVNVALGTSFTSDKLGALMAIASKQEQILQTLGPQNPLVTMGQYANTLRRIVELSGFRDTSSFLNALPLDYSMPTPQPQPTPEQTMAQTTLQVEQMKANRELAIKQAELQLKQREQDMHHEIELKKLALEDTLRRYQIDAQFHANYSAAQLDADAEQERQYLDAAIQVSQLQRDAVQQQQRQAAQDAQMMHSQALAQQGQAHDQALARQQQAHEQQMAEQQQAAQQTSTDGESNE